MRQLIHISRCVLIVAAAVGISAIQEADAATINDPFVELYNVSPNSVGQAAGQFIRFGCCGGSSITDVRGGTATTTNLINGNFVTRIMSFRPSPVSPNF